MSERALVLRITFHAPLYHGQPEWPPSPARLFQALVAGAARRLEEPTVAKAFRWLELQEAPLIAVPRSTLGQAVTFYVPSNDLDERGGDPAAVPGLRIAKVVQARHLGHSDLLYTWPAGNSDEACEVAKIAAMLYQFGRGHDMASGVGEVVDAETLVGMLDAWDGDVHRPSDAAGDGLACPRDGTFDSLRRRHAAFANRFHFEVQGRSVTEVFTLPPRALLRRVPYDANVRRAMFELRRTEDPARFSPTKPEQVVELVSAWRDAAVERLVGAGLASDEVEESLVGVRPGDMKRVQRTQRVRLVPLPSVGHAHTDELVRRLLVEVPEGGLLRFEDVRWAFSGLTLGKVILIEAEDTGMRDRYLRPSTRWATVTPAALPAARRRIDPQHQMDESKRADEREAEERAAIAAVRQALRHAEVRERLRRVEVQREPFSTHGTRAERFDRPPRFAKERLWHVLIEFARPVRGILAIGDGRFLGLGVMRPEDDAPLPMLSFRICEGLIGEPRPRDLARHLRRAVLSRAQVVFGRRPLPETISGHRADGGRAEGHQHLHHLVDSARRRLIVWQPHPDNRLVAALRELTELRAGDMGVLRLEMESMDERDPLLGPAARWRSVTPYRVERHRRVDSAENVVALDVEAACKGYPPVKVEVLRVRSVVGGVEADVELSFERPVIGPIVLGKTRHLGGGLFEGVI